MGVEAPVAHASAAPQPALPRPGRARLVHLDRLKITLTGGVIIAHAAMSYGAAGTWIYEEDSLSDPAGLALSVLVGGGILFVLGLFFLIAGMLTTGPLERRGPRRFLVSRLWRLGLPVAAYALVVWPMLQWLVDTATSEAGTPWESYRRQLSGSQWQSRGTGPMWFVGILFVVTLGWCLWRWRFPASRATATASPGTTVADTSGIVNTWVGPPADLTKLPIARAPDWTTRLAGYYTFELASGKLLHAVSSRINIAIAQSALGMTPFSVAFGALQVQDELTVRYSVLAARRK